MTDPELEALRAAKLRDLETLAALRQAPTAAPGAVPAGVLEATDASILDIIAKQPLVAVDAYATWCGPCKVFAPTFARAAQAHPKVALVKIDVDRNPRFASAFRIQSIPTLLLFAQGRLAGSIPGALRPNDLDAVLTRLEHLETQA